MFSYWAPAALSQCYQAAGSLNFVGEFLNLPAPLLSAMAAASAGPLSCQVTSASSNPSVCQAPFALNRQKLGKNLVQAASCEDEPDVITEVKNSGKFVSLKCSLAFFQSVACPVLLSLGPSFNNETDGFLVSAADKHRVDTVDTTGLTTTHLLKFTIMAQAQERKSVVVGGETVEPSL